MLCVALITASLLAAGPEGGVTSANQAFSEGQAAFASERYDEALTAFQRAFALAPHAAVRFNIAVCLERLGRLVEAQREYDAAATSEELSPSERQRARRLSAELGAKIGFLEVTAAWAPGARVLVDDRPACVTPCRVAIDPGAHDVLVELPGAPFRGRVTAAAGATHALVVPELTIPAAPGAPEPRWKLGALGWTGAAVALAGGAGTAFFGLRTRSLAERYREEPTVETREDGLRSRALANASIAVGVSGLVALALDLLVFGGEPGAAP